MLVYNRDSDFTTIFGNVFQIALSYGTSFSFDYYYY